MGAASHAFSREVLCCYLISRIRKRDADRTAQLAGLLADALHAPLPMPFAAALPMPGDSKSAATSASASASASAGWSPLPTPTGVSVFSLSFVTTLVNELSAQSARELVSDEDVRRSCVERLLLPLAARDSWAHAETLRLLLAQAVRTALPPSTVHRWIAALHATGATDDGVAGHVLNATIAYASSLRHALHRHRCLQPLTPSTSCGVYGAVLCAVRIMSDCGSCSRS
jgi:hypothetical protein